jgi:hypothetical protein
MSAGSEPVIVQVIGDRVFVSESFDQKTADALRKLITAQTPAGKSTEIRGGNLSLRVASRYFAVQRALFQ